jgi:hypothetical protein
MFAFFIYFPCGRTHYDVCASDSEISSCYGPIESKARSSEIAPQFPLPSETEYSDLGFNSYVLLILLGPNLITPQRNQVCSLTFSLMNSL